MTELPIPDSNANATICQYEVANDIADTDKRHRQGAADQKRPRPVAVDEEPHRRLQHGGRGRHHRHRQAELGKRHVKGLLPGDKHRRQAELIIMRQEMAGAEQRVDPCVAAKCWKFEHSPMLL